MAGVLVGKRGPSRRAMQSCQICHHEMKFQQEISFLQNSSPHDAEFM
jgi:hypothetical protein